MPFSEEWRCGQQRRNNEDQRTSPRYKLLLENRAEDNTRKACLKKEKRKWKEKQGK